jgi:dihydrofolate synthase/folylpolyglutamate synthase
MTYPDAIRFLYELRLFGLKLGLENTLRLATVAGEPHRRLRFIHVAGTNGKGSTCAMLEAVYRAAGLRVGLFTSPHLVSFRERIQVNRQLIDEAAVVRLVDELRPFLSQFPPGHHPTFFEVVTVLALRYFALHRCDLVIWETGLGGRLDATNIVTPLASVITNIQFDHQKWLGQTRPQIAAEKAGIIKPAVPVVTATDDPEALEVIARTAVQQQAPLTVVTAAEARAGPTAPLALPLLGEHQRLNAALAWQTVRVVQPAVPVPEAALRAGLEQVRWPGRLQLVKGPGGQELLLDGAHNAAGADALRAAVERHFPARRPALILGILEDKDWPYMAQVLAPMADRVFTVPVKSERTAKPESLRAACAAAHPQAAVVATRSLAEALERTGADRFVVIAGSLYLVGEAMEKLGVAPADGPSEQALNEWSGPTSP